MAIAVRPIPYADRARRSLLCGGTRSPVLRLLSGIPYPVCQDRQAQPHAAQPAPAPRSCSAMSAAAAGRKCVQPQETGAALVRAAVAIWTDFVFRCTWLSEAFR